MSGRLRPLLINCKCFEPLHQRRISGYLFEFSYSWTGEVKVLEGHAFIVEAAVSVGGREMKQGINIHRFANRIPLLFEVPRDLSTAFGIPTSSRYASCMRTYVRNAIQNKCQVHIILKVHHSDNLSVRSSAPRSILIS